MSSVASVARPHFGHSACFQSLRCVATRVYCIGTLTVPYISRALKQMFSLKSPGDSGAEPQCGQLSPAAALLPQLRQIDSPFWPVLALGVTDASENTSTYAVLGSAPHGISSVW